MVPDLEKQNITYSTGPRMSDQYLYREGGSSFHEGHGRNIIDNKGAEVTGNPLSEAENQRTYFTHSSNMSGQIPSLGEDLVFTEYDEIFGDGDPLSIGNHGRHLSDTHYTGIPSSQTEYHTNFSMDFSGSGFNPHPESNSSFTKNVGGLSCDLHAAANFNSKEYDETRYSTKFEQP